MATKPRAAKNARTLWLIDHRKAAKLKTPDIARIAGVSDDTVRGWEAGRGIGPDGLAKLEEHFGESAPGGPEDSGDLAAALNAQAVALGKIADRLDDLVRTRDANFQHLAEGIGTALREALGREPAGSSPAAVRPVSSRRDRQP
jgi:transcriptional regulator with XRE-family HTH domain